MKAYNGSYSGRETSKFHVFKCGSRVKFGVRAGSVVSLKWGFVVRFGIEVSE